MLLPALLLLPSLSTVSAQQCTASSDCPSPDAPYCSRWGWCQWTAQYGAAGPSEAEDTDLPLGSCRSAQDCTPRAPVCSSQGYCTWQPSYQDAGSADTSRGNQGSADTSHGNQISQTVSSQGSQGQAISRPRNNQQSQQPSRAVTGRESRVQQQFIKSQANHLDLGAERALVTNNFKRSSGRGNSNHRKNNQIKQKQSKRTLAPVPAVPDQTTQRPRNLPQLFEPLIAVPVPGIQRRVPSTTTAPPPDNIDRVSTDYYEYYDYNYYADFEVMKQEEPAAVKSHTRGGPAPSNNQRGSSSRSQEKPRNQAHQAPRASVSQGCLADCVTDCVAIEQLRAYRDCVEFCGRTCNDKK